jgi:O-antigen/teichoic acid export membrane protein
MLTEGLSYITMPMSVGLMLTADSFVHVALGPQWETAILPLRILGLYVIMNASQMLFSHVILWTGAYRAYMWLSLLSVVIVPSSMLIGAPWGLGGVAWAWVLSYPLTTVPALLVAHRILGLNAREFFGVLRPAATGCAVMAAAVVLVRWLLPDWPHGAKLAAQVATGAATYVAVMLAVFGPRVGAIYRLIRGSARPATFPATAAGPP